MKIDHNSYGTLALVYLVCIAISVVVVLLVPQLWIRGAVIAAMVWVCVWQTAFFRVPKRNHTAGPQEVTSVADGKVVIIEKVFEPEFLKRDCI